MSPLDELSGLVAGETGTTFVVRLSRTAQGVRTYTVGASIPEGQYEPTTIERLFELERAIVADIDGGHSSSKRSGGSLAAQMRRTIILNVLRQRADWMTTAEILAKAGAAVRSRSQLVADLSTLVRDGYVTYDAGGPGRGNHSRYEIVK